VYYVKNESTYSSLLLLSGEETVLLLRPESAIAGRSVKSATDFREFLEPLNRTFSYCKSPDIVLKTKFIPLNPSPLFQRFLILPMELDAILSSFATTRPPNCPIHIKETQTCLGYPLEVFLSKRNKLCMTVSEIKII
jgi:hypothetical protein